MDKGIAERIRCEWTVVAYAVKNTHYSAVNSGELCILDIRIIPTDTERKMRETTVLAYAVKSTRYSAVNKWEMCIFHTDSSN